MEPVVGQFMGQSVGIGMLISVLTQFVKTAKTIPYINKIPGVQKLIDAISASNKEEIRIFVAIIAVVLNAISLYINNAEIISVQMAISSFGSFLSALGTYDLVLREEKQDNPSNLES